MTLGINARRALLTIGGVLIGTIVYSGIRPVPQLSYIDGLRVNTRDGIAFDRDRWETGNPAQRGEMVADLLRKNQLDGAHATEVDSLLGAHDCYLWYDDEPCYLVDVGGRQYRLEFPVSHSGKIGRVLSIDLDPDEIRARKNARR